MDGIIKNLKSINISVQILYSLAVIVERLGSLTNSLSIIKWAITNAPNNQKLYLHASRLYLKKGQVDKAVTYWKKAVGQENIGSFLYWLKSHREKSPAVSHAHTGQWAHQAELEERHGDNLTNSNNIGLELLENGYVQDALKMFLHDLEEGGADAVLCFNIGLALNKLNRHPEALEFYEKAQNLGLNNLGLLNNKGYSLFLLNRFEEAQICYELARGLAPNDYDILNNLAACYIKTNQQNKAVDYLTRAAQTHPGDATLENNLAMCLETTGHEEEALKHYDIALQLGKSEKDKRAIELNKIKCLITLHRHQDALVLCNSLPDEEFDCELWSIKGELLCELGKTSEAADSYRKAFGLISLAKN